MPVNFKAPSARQSPVLVVDPVNNAPNNGSVDAIFPNLTNVTVGANTGPVNVCQEWNSSFPALLPRLTYAQLGALLVNPFVPGEVAFDSTNNGIAILNGALANNVVTNGFVATSNYLMVATTLTQANVQGMFAAPVQILPAPGAGMSIIVHKAVLVNNFNTAVFANGGAVSIIYGGGGAVNTLTAPIPAAFINNNAPASYSLNAGLTGATTTGTTNRALVITNATGAFTGGNALSTIVVNVWFSIIPDAA
jgi:hypothetical protein